MIVGLPVDYFNSGNELKTVERLVLARAERRLEDIARVLYDWIWETDRDLKLIHVSDRVIEQPDFTREN